MLEILGWKEEKKIFRDVDGYFWVWHWKLPLRTSLTLWERKKKEKKRKREGVKFRFSLKRECILLLSVFRSTGLLVNNGRQGRGCWPRSVPLPQTRYVRLSRALLQILPLNFKNPYMNILFNRRNPIIFQIELFTFLIIHFSWV